VGGGLFRTSPKKKLKLFYLCGGVGVACPYINFWKLQTNPNPFFTYYQLPITNYPLPITNYQLPITHYQLPITHYPLPITHYQLPITHYQLPITNYPLPEHFSRCSCLLLIRRYREIARDIYSEDRAFS
jgi:hypothetical protein